MDQEAPAKRLRCRVGRHRWVTRTNAGARWQECARCGRFRNQVVTASRFPPGGDGATGAGAGL